MELWTPIFSTIIFFLLKLLHGCVKNDIIQETVLWREPDALNLLNPACPKYGDFQGGGGGKKQQDFLVTQLLLEHSISSIFLHLLAPHQ